MVRSFLPALFLAAVPFAATSLAASAQDRAPIVPTVTVTGSAFRDVEPDRATLSVGVTSEKPSAADASNDNARIAQGIVAEIRAAGIDAKDIQTSTLSLSPVYSSGNGGAAPRITGYRATNMVTVLVRKLDQAAPLVQRLTEKGITNLSGPSFDVSNAQGIVDELRGTAARDARRLAEIYAGALGTKLGRVMDIRADTSPPAPVFKARAMVAASPAAAPPVEAGTQRLSTDVTVTFELLQ